METRQTAARPRSTRSRTALPAATPVRALPTPRTWVNGAARAADAYAATRMLKIVGGSAGLFSMTPATAARAGIPARIDVRQGLALAAFHLAAAVVRTLGGSTRVAATATSTASVKALV